MSNVVMGSPSLAGVASASGEWYSPDRTSNSIEVATLARVALGRRVKGDRKRGGRAVLAELVHRQRAPRIRGVLAAPGFQAAPHCGDGVVRHVTVGDDGPAAEVKRRHIFLQKRVLISADHVA